MQEKMKLSQDTTPEDIKVFSLEADELIQRLDEDLVKLEQEQTNPELLQEIFRAAHTIKGSAGMLGYQPMAELAHAMESILDKLRKGTLSVNPRVVDSLLHSLDTLKTLRDQLTSQTENEISIKDNLGELEVAGNSGYNGNRLRESVRPITNITLDASATAKLKALIEMGRKPYQIKITLGSKTQWAAVRCFQILAELAEIAEIFSSIPSREEIEQEKVGLNLELLATSLQEVDQIKQAICRVEEVATVEIIPFSLPCISSSEINQPVAVVAGTESRKSVQQPQTVRIDVERLDDLVNTIGELVIDRTRIVQICKVLESKYKGDDLVLSLRKTSAHIVKVVDNLQENTMKLRMLPIGVVFSGFPRMVRDLAQKANKKIELIVQGQDTEIDRTVIERIRDPLVHLLRNSVDHGIESPEQRKAAGKSETGVMRLSAYHEQGHMVITVEDDGHGINPRIVADSAVRKGIVTAEVAARLTDSEAVNLVFLPGVSTAKKTTEISGRGVGMDIVRTNVTAINGFVSVETSPGKGTKFILKLPLTLATLQGLLVSSKTTVYAIPLVHVLETVNLKPKDIYTVGGSEVIKLRGNVLPLFPLNKALGENTGDKISRENTYAVIVRFGEKLVGLVVDSLLETQDIVVKSLGKYIGNIKGVAGASILGDGRVVLILDVPTLVNTLQKKPAETVPVPV